MSQIVNVSTAKICADQKAQPRTSIDTDLVGQYTEDMANGAEFPPLVVFFDGAVNWIADGFHRYYAGIGLGLAEMRCDVREGGLRDAILFSCSANASHGLRRTNADKRRAVMRLLDDDEWSRWSDREIAARCGVDNKTVGALRPKPSEEIPQIDDRSRLVRRGGTVYEQNTSRIGSAPRPREDAPVFDNTPSGEGWQASAPPSAVVEITSVNRETQLSNSIWEIVEKAKTLPDPEEAARRFPALLLHTLRDADLVRVSHWFSEFVAEIQNRKAVKNVAS